MRTLYPNRNITMEIDGERVIVARGDIAVHHGPDSDLMASVTITSFVSEDLRSKFVGSLGTVSIGLD